MFDFWFIPSSSWGTYKMAKKGLQPLYLQK
jgi:hypothetical protein